jgi:hypothetical protein
MFLVRPPTPIGLRPSFGFGDRLGLATPGHVDAMRAYGDAVQPVFAQQSMRELLRTERKATDVMRDTVAALTACSFTHPWSADADHLKNPEDINTAASAGFVWLTLDGSDLVDPHADSYSPTEVDTHYRMLRDDIHWADEYLGKTIAISPHVVLDCNRTAVRRAAVKFGKAIAHVVKMAAHADRVMGKRREGYEIEVAFDEVPQVITPLEHFLIAEQCLQSHVKLVNLALRFSDRLEPAVEFEGEREPFFRTLKTHVEIARVAGPYKLSLHCGSDKFSLYEEFARVTGGMFHVKTAGTSYLEALRVTARHERKLFRRIVDFSRQRFERDKASYRVSAKLTATPCAAAIADDRELERIYIDSPAGRQVLYVTFGSVLTDHVLGAALRDVLVANPEVHRQFIAHHLGKHLEPLARGVASLPTTTAKISHGLHGTHLRKNIAAVASPAPISISQTRDSVAD